MELDGGIASWKEMDLEIEKGENPTGLRRTPKDQDQVEGNIEDSQAV